MPYMKLTYVDTDSEEEGATRSEVVPISGEPWLEIATGNNVAFNTQFGLVSAVYSDNYPEEEEAPAKKK